MVVVGSSVLTAGGTPPGPAPYPVGPQAFGLVVEVVSPGSRTTDRVAKPRGYAAAGIPLFWRVETEPDLLVQAFVLRAGAYESVGTVRERGPLPVPWGTAQVDIGRLAA